MLLPREYDRQTAIAKGDKFATGLYQHSQEDLERFAALLHVTCQEFDFHVCFSREEFNYKSCSLHFYNKESNRKLIFDTMGLYPTLKMIDLNKNDYCPVVLPVMLMCISHPERIRTMVKLIIDA